MVGHRPPPLLYPMMSLQSVWTTAPLKYLMITKKKGVYFGWAFFLISSGSPHVRLMGTRGEPGEIGLAAMGEGLDGS